MWSVEYHVTIPSTISIVSSSSATSSRRQCVGRAPGMLLEDVFELCRKSKEDILRSLRRELIIGISLIKTAPGVLKDG